MSGKPKRNINKGVVIAAAVAAMAIITIIIFIFIMAESNSNTHGSDGAKPSTSSALSSPTSVTNPLTTSIPTTTKPLTSSVPAAKQTNTLTDCGYHDKTRGWYNFSNNNYGDYCRYTGDYNNPQFMCAPAGSTNQYVSNAGWSPNADHKELVSGDKCYFPPTGRQTTTLTDCGYPTGVQGWYSFSGNGPNDYCRFVGDAGSLDFKCAPAFSTNQYVSPPPTFTPMDILRGIPLAPGDKCYVAN